MPELLHSGLGGRAFFLCDLLQHESESGNGSQHRTQYLSLQNRQSGDRRQSVDRLHGYYFTVHEAAFDLELVVQLLSVVGNDSCRSHGIIVTNGDTCGTVELIIKFLESYIVECEAKERFFTTV